MYLDWVKIYLIFNNLCDPTHQTIYPLIGGDSQRFQFFKLSWLDPQKISIFQIILISSRLIEFLLTWGVSLWRWGDGWIKLLVCPMHVCACMLWYHRDFSVFPQGDSHLQLKLTCLTCMCVQGVSLQITKNSTRLGLIEIIWIDSVWRFLIS